MSEDVRSAQKLLGMKLWVRDLVSQTHSERVFRQREELGQSHRVNLRE